MSHARFEPPNPAKRLGRRARFFASAAIALAAVTLVAACSSAAGSASSAAPADTASAKAALKAATAMPTFTLKAPTFDISGIKGKTIFNIPVSSQVPYVVSVDQAAAKIAERLGARWVEYTDQGQTSQITAGIQQAISQKADLIILAQGIDPTTQVAALQQAKAAGIPVLLTHTEENGVPIAAPAASLLAGQVAVPFDEAGALEMDWAVANTNGNADILIINSSAVPASNGIVKAEQAELTKICPACKSTVVDVQVTDWNTRIPKEVQSALQRDPDINVIAPLYDSMSLDVEPGIKQAGKSGKVAITSYNGTPAVVNSMTDGSVPDMKMDVGESIPWLAYATIDQAGRILTGTPVITSGNEETPLRVIDASNVADLGKPPAPDGSKGYGDSYITGYDALWSVK